MRILKLAFIALVIAYLLIGSDRFTRLQDTKWTPHTELVSDYQARLNQSKILMNPTFLIGPKDNLKWAIISRLDAAKNRILLSVYMLTDAEIIQALIAAKQRWVMVRVILEPSVYLLPKINKKAYALLSDAGVSVKYSSERDFNFNHSKYFIIDQILLLGTGNMTKSSLLQNREFFIATDSVAEVNYTVSLFEHDAEHMPMFVPENSLVISPLNARSAIQGFISSARQSITLMSESLSDTQTVDLLVAAKLRRLTVSVCLPDDRPLWTVQKIKLQKAWVQLLTSHKPHVHAKTILVDNQKLLIGSINFTDNSIDRNREASIIIGGNTVVQRYNKIIASDCKG